MSAPLGWGGIIRLGLVQSSLGAIVMLATSLLNRIMVVEYALAASIPAGLVAWHYAVQLSRPKWGHGSDLGHRRTPWIIGGMGVLAMGALLATNATLLMDSWPTIGFVIAVFAYAMIGAGVGASGTSLLALLATHTAPERRPVAAATTWIMMIFGIVVTAGVVGQLLDPFSPQRLANIAGGVSIAAFLVTLTAVYGVERIVERPQDRTERSTFGEAVANVWGDRTARHFTVFVFVSMLAYSMQDMILEPMAGLVFGFTPGQSTSLSSAQHMGVLLGMLLVGFGGRAFGRNKSPAMRRWIVGGCLGSALSLALLCGGVSYGSGWPLTATVFALGFANGIFAVSAIAAMMDLAGADGGGSEGIRMGIWGASQAMAFGLGGFSGALGFDLVRTVLPTNQAFITVFFVEATLFVIAAGIMLGFGREWRAAAPAERVLA